MVIFQIILVHENIKTTLKRKQSRNGLDDTKYIGRWNHALGSDQFY